MSAYIHKLDCDVEIVSATDAIVARAKQLRPKRRVRSETMLCCDGSDSRVGAVVYSGWQ